MWGLQNVTISFLWFRVYNNIPRALKIVSFHVKGHDPIKSSHACLIPVKIFEIIHIHFFFYTI